MPANDSADGRSGRVPITHWLLFVPESILVLNEPMKHGSRKRSKAKLREELEKEVREICKSTEKDILEAEKMNEQPNLRTRRKSFSFSSADLCFEQLYECVSTRTNYLNIVNLSSRDSSEPDIDRVILQALLKGNRLTALVHFSVLVFSGSGSELGSE